MVYKEFLRAGLHFPLHPVIIKILNLYQVIPVQLVLNSIWIIYSFIILCHDLSIELEISLFYVFLMIKRYPKAKRWWFIRPHHGQSFIKSLPSAIHDWKGRFFFLSSDLAWGFSFVRKEPNLSPNDDKKMIRADKANFTKLLKIKVPL